MLMNSGSRIGLRNLRIGDITVIFQYEIIFGMIRGLVSGENRTCYFSQKQKGIMRQNGS